ncbi:M28 family peptidase [Sphingobium boeckii]|uniref:Peptidase M28 domain-containing protein n=1 Tax=Sphingobium boeckii TaxID=1082345 RepID=A0A7W9AL12_9SPHN|nr:M28 family peptidase [Sphingobium boeckii]MBB5687369.1 hypothetical protein [Sphingobium boeckii]
MKSLCIAALLPLIVANAAPADIVSEADLRGHIAVLASDAFEGRAPGTEGETKTIHYIADQFARVGLSQGSGTQGWFQPVKLIERTPRTAGYSFTRQGKPIAVDASNFVLRASAARTEIEKAPLIFLGYGNNSKGLDPAGAVAMILQEAPDGSDYRVRRNAVLRRGAKAVIGIVAADFDFDALERTMLAPVTVLAPGVDSGAEGMMTLEAASALAFEAGKDVSALIEDAAQPGYAGVALGIQADLKIGTDVRAFESHNVIGKVAGRDPKAGAIMLTAHWDHLGLCREEGAADRICNGAIDNASGVALLIETARHLAHGPKPRRSIYFMATTAEERGLLGALGFIADPLLPRADIRAVLNADTVAVAGKGATIAVIGKGTVLDPFIARAAAVVGRKVDPDGDADIMVQRQDGWAFAREKIPAVMIGGTFSDMALAQKYLQSTYHGPDDALTDTLDLGGAADDATLHVVLARMLANAADLGG